MIKNLQFSVFLLGGLCIGQVGVNTGAPGSTLDIRGSVSMPYKLINTAAYTFTDQDQFLDFRGAAVSLWYLPTAVSGNKNFVGRYYEIRNGSGVNITVYPAGSELIDVANNSNSQANVTIPSGYYAIIKSNGATSGVTWVATLIAPNSTTTVTQSRFSSSILGYSPSKTSERVVPAAFGGATVTEKGCEKWSVNGHTYCAYTLSAAKNFYDTFSFAKQVGGYVVTITSNDERTWLYTNILTKYALNNNIWIGYNKVAYPGNSTSFTWITGEDWTIDWTTSPNSTPQNYFNSGEPNNSGGSEGSCHIYGLTLNADRKWNDLSGSSTSQNSVNFDNVILEFNED
ncbi:hypothetical protein O2K51_07550 [Apibacter raozihei]|uniref:hypothetical protein n=1 Tax=Apibacter raozihei TaxID=2500547 RepID=UPI000FE419BD|nr:hypothetical protein [Apibacter raozihei]